MAPVNDRPFLEHLLDYWIGQGLRRAVLAVGYRAVIIRDHFGDGYRDLAIDYAVETTPAGTGGGLLLALERLRGPRPFLVLNGDTLFEVDLEAMQRAHRASKAEATIALTRQRERGRYGSVTLERDGRLVAFGPQAHQSADALVNGGVYLFERSLFAPDKSRAVPVSLEAELIPAWLEAERRVFGVVSGGRFLDIGLPEDYRAAAAVLPAENGARASRLVSP